MTIVLNDNTTIEAELNGNNYIVDKEVADEKLDRTNLVKITIDGMEYENMKCQHFMENGKQHLIFMPMSEEEIKNADLLSKIEYIAMMTDVDLGE